MARKPPSVTTYYRKREGYWTVRWREHGRQIEHGGYPTQADAVEAAHHVRQRLRTGLPGVRSTLPLTDLVAAWWNTYVNTDAVTAATREGYRNDTRRILEYLAHTDAATLTQPRVREWRDTIADTHSARAANKAMTALSSAYQRGIEAGITETNPCRGIRALPEVRQRIHMPTRRHVEILEQTAPTPRELAMLMVASRGALRQSELLGLTWENVNTTDGSVFIRQVADRDRHIRQSPKTQRSNRRVPLPPAAVDALEQIRPPAATGLIFPSPTDPTRPLHRRSWGRYHWQRWRLAATWHAAATGEPPAVWQPLLTVEWKNLRHHAISRWAAAGASTLQVSRWSGDAITTIDKHYAHLFDEDETAIMTAIE